MESRALEALMHRNTNGENYNLISNDKKGDNTVNFMQTTISDTAEGYAT